MLLIEHASNDLITLLAIVSIRHGQRYVGDGLCSLNMMKAVCAIQTGSRKYPYVVVVQASFGVDVGLRRHP